MRRILVARAPRFERDARKLTFDGVHVGVLRWVGETEPPLAVRTEGYAAGKSWLTLAITSVARSIGMGPARWLAPAPLTPADFVPWRAAADVLVRGNVPAGPFRVASGRFQRSLRASMGVTGPKLTNEAGLPLEPKETAPLSLLEPGIYGVMPAEAEAFQRAAEALRAQDSELGEEVAVELADGSRRTWHIPPERPRLFIYAATEGGEDREIAPRIDTLVIDLDEDQLCVVWRAEVPTLRDDARDIDKIALGFAPRDADIRDILRELPRGEFGWAWELDEVERGELPPSLDAEELAVARYDTWDAPEGPLPSISMEKYAAIAAELGEQREPRDRALARHDFDPYRWDVEDRAWAEAMAEPPPDEEDPQESIAEGYARFFVAAQDRLAAPEEAALTPERYAELTVAMETEEPPRVLAAAGMGLGAYQRLDRRMRARTAAEPDFAIQLEELMDARRAATPPADDASETSSGSASATSSGTKA